MILRNVPPRKGLTRPAMKKFWYQALPLRSAQLTKGDSGAIRTFFSSPCARLRQKFDIKNWALKIVKKNLRLMTGDHQVKAFGRFQQSLTFR